MCTVCHTTVIAKSTRMSEHVLQDEYCDRYRDTRPTFVRGRAILVETALLEAFTAVVVYTHSAPLYTVPSSTQEMKKKLQTKQRRMTRMIIQTKRKTGKSWAAAHAASVVVTADDPTVNRGTTRLGTDLLAASGITSWILRQSLIYWRQARMIAKHHESKLVSNCKPAISTKQEGYRKQGRPAKRWEYDHDIYL